MQSRDIKVGEDYALKQRSWQAPVRAHVVAVVRHAVPKYTRTWYPHLTSTLKDQGHRIDRDWSVGVTGGQVNTFVVVTTDKPFAEGTKILALGRQLESTWADYEAKQAKLKASNAAQRAKISAAWDEFNQQAEAVGAKLSEAGFDGVHFEGLHFRTGFPPRTVTVVWADLLKALHVDGD